MVTFKGNPVQIIGKLPQSGQQAPDFSLVDPSMKECSLQSFQGKKKLISIVPSLDTPVCLLSSKVFNKQASKMPNTTVLVVSADLPFAMKRVCAAEGIDHLTCLSMMRSKDFAQDYGVLIQDGPMAGLTTRAIVIIDENDQVIYSELVQDIANEPNYEKALEALKD